MNTALLIARVTAQVGLDYLEEDERTLALDYINEAYGELMRVYRPYEERYIGLNGDGIIDPQEAGFDIGSLITIYALDVEVPYDIRDGKLLVQPIKANVTVKLRCDAPNLSGDDDEPELPEKWHGALADYATWRMLANGGKARQQRGEMYYARYLQRKAMLPPESPMWRERLVRKY